MVTRSLVRKSYRTSVVGNIPSATFSHASKYQLDIWNWQSCHLLFVQQATVHFHWPSTHSHPLADLVANRSVSCEMPARTDAEKFTFSRVSELQKSNRKWGRLARWMRTAHNTFIEDHDLASFVVVRLLYVNLTGVCFRTWRTVLLCLKFINVSMVEKYVCISCYKYRNCLVSSCCIYRTSRCSLRGSPHRQKITQTTDFYLSIVATAEIDFTG